MAPSAQNVRKTRASDDLIMATNNSSIVSKRSVEHLYYPDEPHYFRFFVKKFRRRAPLVNRGYHLRLKVIDTLVRRFLEKPSTRKKVIVNLGCGSDVLPWQCQVRYPDSCRDVTFLDVDYPDLIQKKRQIVLETPELQDLMGAWEVNDDSPIVLKSQKYCQVECDLRQLSVLQSCLEALFDVPKTDFMFVAEVSITYMDTEGANGVIEWAATVGNAEFCLLEQILPDGPDHPFALTMLGHFNKMNAPLKSVHRYPTVASQEKRFESLGWPSVESWTLWEAWSDNLFMTADERRALDAVEPFDELEEFALFASHYFVILATTPRSEAQGHVSKVFGEVDIQSFPSPMVMSAYESTRGHRRLGAAMLVEKPNSHGFISHNFGQGPVGRMNSEDLYQISSQPVSPTLSVKVPSARVGQSITDLGSAGVLLAGGRASPSTAFRDCWLFNKHLAAWEPTKDLPVPLFRHSVTRLGSSPLALLAGGRKNHRETSADYFLFDPAVGWKKCEVQSAPPALYSTTFVCTGDVGPRGITGFLTGGSLEDSVINQEIYTWELDLSEAEPVLSFQHRTSNDGIVSSTFARLGSIVVQSLGYTLVLGGVIKGVQLPSTYDILVLKATRSDVNVVARLDGTDSSGVVRPFLMGSSVVLYGDGNFAIVGGGATCYAMGTFWTPGSYSFRFDPSLLPQHSTGQVASRSEPVKYVETIQFVENEKTPVN
ncbi:leucine carboxyl methyltransferase [Colletotrichum orchidophilum]|uniref:tRNA wybutosine-synthesizing protein 4 n=1 Tax=Colletotrichum orchidophilum TaxID=1209926 RepID=A0A1G4AT08_9PEZI|nr:leucine carboxyl methyltransferase [Colletotrichum orchidophilum]OHE92297.1 leucine carboxyl methyltransferase [Colletotrichum orchidophilum]